MFQTKSSHLFRRRSVIRSRLTETPPVEGFILHVSAAPGGSLKTRRVAGGCDTAGPDVIVWWTTMDPPPGTPTAAMRVRISDEEHLGELIAFERARSEGTILAKGGTSRGR